MTCAVLWSGNHNQFCCCKISVSRKFSIFTLYKGTWSDTDTSSQQKQPGQVTFLAGYWVRNSMIRRPDSARAELSDKNELFWLQDWNYPWRHPLFLCLHYNPSFISHSFFQAMPVPPALPLAYSHCLFSSLKATVRWLDVPCAITVLNHWGQLP